MAAGEAGPNATIVNIPAPVDPPTSPLIVINIRTIADTDAVAQQVTQSVLTALAPHLASLESSVDTLETQGVQEMADLSALTASVTDIVGASESTIALLTDIAAQLRAAATDPAAIQALADQLDAEKSNLANAVAANSDLQTPPTP